MSKAVLVMDMPSSCDECPLLLVGRYCKAKEAPNVAVDSKLNKNKPDWCPLHPMPEKTDRRKAKTETVGNWIDGWNACIDAIGGGYCE